MSLLLWLQWWFIEHSHVHIISKLIPSKFTLLPILFRHRLPVVDVDDPGDSLKSVYHEVAKVFFVLISNQIALVADPNGIVRRIGDVYQLRTKNSGVLEESIIDL